MMRMRTADVVSLAVIGIVWVLALALYLSMPESIPTRWNLATGEPGGHVPRLVGVVIFAAMPVIPYLVMKAITVISPHGYRMTPFLRVVDIFTVALTVGIGAVSGAAVLAASGYDVPVSGLVPAIAGIILVVFGNYLGKVRKNFFLGVRVPWTLANEEVWVRTHRLAGWLFVLSGISVLIAGILRGRASLAVMITLILLSIVAPIVYSLLLYRRTQGFRDVDEEYPES